MKEYKDCKKIKGFVDIHIHGCAGYDIATCGADGLREMSKVLAKHGVVAFLPTIPASSAEQTLSALKAMHEVMNDEEITGARIVGVHLEGPFMKEAYKGALDYTSFIPATIDNWKSITGEYESIVKRITVDPLQDGVMDMIPYFVKNNISVTVGHTAADAETVFKAFEQGATGVTHIYNAMPSLHHRNPGPVGAALASDCVCELILDFLHVAPIAAKVVLKAKGVDKVAIITDSCEAAGMPDGDYELGGRIVYVRNGEARLPAGNLASSTVFMDQELKNIIKLGYTLEDAEKMLSITPANLISFKHDNDYTIIDKDMNIKAVIIKGKTVYEA